MPLISGTRRAAVSSRVRSPSMGMPGWRKRCSSAPCHQLWSRTTTTQVVFNSESSTGLCRDCFQSVAVLQGHRASVLQLQPHQREGFRRGMGESGRPGMVGGVKAQYDCIKAFSETDFTAGLKKIELPTLVMHGEDDQTVPFADAPLSAKLLQHSTIRPTPGCRMACRRRMPSKSTLTCSHHQRLKPVLCRYSIGHG